MQFVPPEVEQMYQQYQEDFQQTLKDREEEEKIKRDYEKQRRYEEDPRKLERIKQNLDRQKEILKEIKQDQEQILQKLEAIAQKYELGITTEKPGKSIPHKPLTVIYTHGQTQVFDPANVTSGEVDELYAILTQLRTGSSTEQTRAAEKLSKLPASEIIKNALLEAYNASESDEVKATILDILAEKNYKELKDVARTAVMQETSSGERSNAFLAYSDLAAGNYEEAYAVIWRYLTEDMDVLNRLVVLRNIKDPKAIFTTLVHLHSEYEKNELMRLRVRTSLRLIPDQFIHGLKNYIESPFDDDNSHRRRAMCWQYFSDIMHEFPYPKEWVLKTIQSRLNLASTIWDERFMMIRVLKNMPEGTVILEDMLQQEPCIDIRAVAFHTLYQEVRHNYAIMPKLQSACLTEKNGRLKQAHCKLLGEEAPKSRFRKILSILITAILVFWVILTPISWAIYGYFDMRGETCAVCGIGTEIQRKLVLPSAIIIFIPLLLTALSPLQNYFGTPEEQQYYWKFREKPGNSLFREAGLYLRK